MLAPLSKLTVPLAISVLFTVALVVLIEPRTIGGVGLLFLIVTAFVVIIAAVFREIRQKRRSASDKSAPRDEGGHPQGEIGAFSSRRHQ